MNLRHQKPLHAYKFPVYGKGLNKRAKKIKQQVDVQPAITDNSLQKSQEKKTIDAQKVSQRHIKRHAKMLAHFIYRVNLMYKQKQIEQSKPAKQQKSRILKGKKKKKDQDQYVSQPEYKIKVKKNNKKTKIILKKKKKIKTQKQNNKKTRQKVVKKPRQKSQSKFLVFLNKQNVQLKTEEINSPLPNKQQRNVQEAGISKSILEPIQNNIQTNQIVKNNSQEQLILHFDCENVEEAKKMKQLQQNNLAYTFESKDYENYSFYSSSQQDNLNSEQKETMRIIEQSFSSVQLSLSL